MDEELEKDLTNVAISRFQKICELDLEGCHVYRILQDNKVFLIIDTSDRHTALVLWKNRGILSESILLLGLVARFVIYLNGVEFRPVLNPFTIGVYKMIPSQLKTEGDIAKMILDSEVSAGLVHLETNTLLIPSPHIQRTAGRDAFYMQTTGRCLDSVWDIDELHRVNQELKQRGTWIDATYSAYSWEFKNGIWQRVKHRFRAKQLEAVQYLKQWCRFSYGVEIVS